MWTSGQVSQRQMVRDGRSWGRGSVVGMRGQKKLPLLRKSCGKLPLATYPMYKRHETIIASGNVELGHIQYTWMPKSIQVQNRAGGKKCVKKKIKEINSLRHTTEMVITYHFCGQEFCRLLHQIVYIPKAACPDLVC